MQTSFKEGALYGLSVDNVQAMAASHWSQHGEPCKSTCESHSYRKLTILKWVLGLKYETCITRMACSLSRLLRIFQAGGFVKAMMNEL